MIDIRPVCAAILLFATHIASAAVLNVRSGEKIEDAIHAAQAGDTVRIARGHYVAHLLIDKPLTLESGEGNGARPVIDGNNEGDVIRVRSPDVTVRGLIVRDSGTDLTAQNAGIYIEPGSDRTVVEHCTLAHNLFGIWLEKSADVQIAHNVIVGRRDLLSPMRGNGIQVYNTDRSQIIDNEISFTRDGVYVDVSRHAVFRGNRIHHVRYGTHYMNTHDSVWENNQSYLNRGGLALMEVRRLTVRGNVTWGNADHGIMLRTIQDSLIENNVVAANGRGFFIYDAEYNTVRHNLIINNRTGVHLSAGSNNNEIGGNDLIGNEDQVRFVATRDMVWGRKEANYWSTYNGWDQDGDGYGDVPYEANDVVDRLNWQYPLAKLLLTSPAVQTLRFVARQFPILRAPSIVEKHPRMHPLTTDWRRWRDTKPD